MILSKQDLMDADLYLYQQAVLAGFPVTQETITDNELTEFLVSKNVIVSEAGPGRGWWGPPVGTHGKGDVGGGAPGTMDEDYRPPRLDEALVGELDEIGKWEVSSAAEELGHSATMKAYTKANNRWTQGAEQEAKHDIHGWLRNDPKVRTLSLYEDWSNSKGDQSFSKWLDTPDVFWRGGGFSSPFMSFTRSKSVAVDASGGQGAWWVKMKPNQLLGSGMTGAGEVYIARGAITAMGDLSESYGDA